MSYPPHQPNPFGQQPHSGGFEAPGTSPYGQPYRQPGRPGQGDPYGQTTHPGGPGAGGEPPKKKTGLIVGIVAAVVVLVVGAVLFTGFVAPGFFVSAEADPEQGQQQPQQEQPQIPPPATAPTLPEDGPSSEPADPPEGGSGPADEVVRIEQVAKTFVDGLNDRDPATIKKVLCNPDLEQESLFTSLPDDIKWSVGGSASVNGQTATVPIKTSGPGGEANSTLTVRQNDGAWCAANLR